MTTTRVRGAGAVTVLVRSTGPAIRQLRPLPAPTEPLADIVDQWGMQSFPASDPPANW